MTQALEAALDGGVLCLQQPLELEPNTRVRIAVKSLPQMNFGIEIAV